MNLNQLIADLSLVGVKLWVDGEELRVRAPKGVLTQQRRNLLTLHKAELVSMLRSNDVSASDTDRPLVRVSREQHLPLSFAQQQMWVLSELSPNSPLYNVPLALRLKGSLNVVALLQSFNEMTQRHEALRTTFRKVNGQPIQAISSSLNITIPVVDLRSQSDKEREIQAHRLAQQEAIRPFDLASDLMLRGLLLHLDEAEYILLLTMHHIAFDGCSQNIFFQELAVLYEAYCNELPSPLPQLPIQYADFAHWQRRWLQGEVLESKLAYWKQQLQDAPTVLELPTDRPRSAVQPFPGATYSTVVPKKLTEALTVLSQLEDVTLFMTLFTAFQILLHRYTGREDICTGTPVANRERAGIDGLIGNFVNTLVLRTKLGGNPSFRELLAQVKEVALGAYAHQDLPFELLVEALQPERSLNYTPLCQVMFELENGHLSLFKLPGLTVNPLFVDSGTAKFDLAVSLENTELGLIGLWEYNTDLFDAATIAQMTTHFQTLLCSVVANPQQQIWELQLLSATEQQELLVKWNDTSADYAKHLCIHQLFEAQVEQTPDAVALVFEDQQLSYHELNVRANRLAHYLQSMGTGSEVLVGLCVERSPEMAVGMLAILKAGGAYVPLDPSYPDQRLAFILSDAGVSVVLTQQHLVERWSQSSVTIVCLDTYSLVSAQQSQDNPGNSVTPEHLAYVMYTSGSTGVPKGVSVVHRGVVRLVKETNYAQLNTEEVFLQLAPIVFDASTFEIWGCLLNGGRLVIMPPQTPSLPELGQAVGQYQVTTLWLTASLFHLMVDQQIKKLKNVRQLLAGGDVLSIPHVQRVVEQLPHLTLVNGYGPTENTTFTCCCPITQLTQVQVFVPIGRPIANTQVYLLDDQLQPVPIGVSGELYTSGDGLSRGYLNRPELTAEKFIPHPFTHQPGTRLYKTGDRARYLRDGDIQFLGRIDTQVKIRGFRIELGEIEANLSQHPDVRQSVVIAKEDVPGSQRLVAYIVPHQGSASTISDLRSFLKEKLPEYMVPSAFVILSSLPLTPNGKVDCRALPEPEGRVELSNSFVAPRTQIEQILTRIWCEVLNLEQVGIHDNFFELGGDSILSILIAAKANQAGLQLTTKQMFGHQTIAELAAVARTTVIHQGEQSLVTGSLPFTPIQHWFFNQNLPDPTHWNQAFLLSVTPEISPKILEPVIQQLLVHHDALRLRFKRTELGWQQTNIGVDNTVALNSIDLSALLQSEQTSALEVAATQLQTSLNLSDGPLVRVAWFFLGNHKTNRLLIAIHHLTVDGVSWRILLEDLQTAYEQLSCGEDLRLPSKTTSFKEWSHKLVEYAQSEALIPEMAYWLSESDRQVTGILVDYLGGANTEVSARTVSMSLSVEETHALLHKVPTAYNTQINDVLLTVLGRVFSEWTGSSSILFNLEGHGRENIIEDVDLSRTVGWFTTIFPVLLEIAATDNPADSLKSVKEQLRRIPNRGIGYGLLRYLRGDAEITARLEALPQAEVSFNYLGQFDQVLYTSSILQPATELPGQCFSLLGNRSHVLDVIGLLVGGQLQMNWIYSENVHQHSTIERLAQKFLATLQELIIQCLSSEAGGWTPSDFPAASLSQKDLDYFITQLTKVEN